MKKLFLWTILIIIGAWFAISASLFYRGSVKRGQVLGESTAKVIPNQIIEDGVSKTVYENNLNLHNILASQNVTVYPEDKMTVYVRPELGIGSTIVVRHATTVYLSDQDFEKDVRTWSETVNDVLKENKIVLRGDDFVDPGKDTRLENNMTIDVIRVKKESSQTEVSIPFETKKQDDPNTWYGSSSILTPGKNGSKKIEYVTTYYNGLFHSKDVVKETVLENPTTKIIGIGTKRRVLSSVRGYATATNLANATVSATYPRGTLIRITNLSSGKQVIKTVNYTWGTATPPAGVVLDLSWSILDELGFNYVGKGPYVLVEEII